MPNGSASCQDHENDEGASSIIYEAPDKFATLLDIPRSLEESQVLSRSYPEAAVQAISALTPRLPRIYSVDPPIEPFATPEPRNGFAAHGAHGYSAHSPAAQVADLMTAARVQEALQHLQTHHSGPYHLTRVTPPSPSAVLDDAPIPNTQTVIPQQAKFLHGPIQGTRQAFLDTAPTFDLMVLDPPWPNRSARRRTDRYTTVTNLQEMHTLLSDIPVTSRLSQNGNSLVAVWITNKPSIVDFLTSPTGIFASWGMELAAEWIWVKITASGEPLYDIDSTWRKPWEKLLIAKRIGTQMHPELKPRVIVAVPDVHSRKPNLRGLFRDALGDEYTGLEVFARNLTAGWWSWGNEVLHFQQPEHWARGVEYSPSWTKENTTD